MRIASHTSGATYVGNVKLRRVGHRRIDHGADAFDELHVDAHREDRGHDVREHHGRVDAVPPHRLQRHLRAELGLARDLPERVALAERAVLRQRPAGLPHEPDGRPLDGLAPGGAHEQRRGHRGTTLAAAMQRVGEHPVPAGPLAVRWLGWEPLRPARAGVVTEVDLMFINAGSAAWPAGPDKRVEVSYHWLDDLGNAIVWGEIWTPLPRAVAPGETIEQRIEVRAPFRAGPHRLAFDLVEERRYWFSELGNTRLEVEVDVQPRIERRLAVVFTPGPPDLVADSHKVLAAQEEALVPLGEAGCARAPGAGMPAGARLVTAHPRRAPERVRGRRRLDRRARAPPAEGARPVEAGQRPRTALQAPAPLSVAHPRRRAVVGVERRRRAAGARASRTRAVALRRADRRHSSTAIRSSTRLNVHAPSASATTVATTR